MRAGLPTVLPLRQAILCQVLCLSRGILDRIAMVRLRKINVFLVLCVLLEVTLLFLVTKSGNLIRVCKNKVKNNFMMLCDKFIPITTALFVAGLIALPLSVFAETASQVTQPSYAPAVTSPAQGSLDLPATSNLTAPAGADTLFVTHQV